MEYTCWNKLIFEYFFNKTSIKTDVLFSVDKYVINEIGQKNNVKNPLLDFCNAINKYTVVLNNRERPSFQVSSINTNIENGVPMQTAVIAFLVLAASKMGEDVLDNTFGNTKILERNYYTQLKKLLNCNNDMQNVEFKSFGNVFENNFEKYKQLFSTFSEYVEQNYNCKVEFRELFKTPKRKSNDWIGIPIFQSMISSKDNALLTQEFEKSQSPLNITNIQSQNLLKFSKVFNLVAKDYPQLLQNRINALFENWDGNVISYTAKGEKIIKQAKQNISPSILYEQNYGRYNFYEIIPKIKNLDTSVVIKTDEHEYTWNSSLEAYCSKCFCIHNNYFKTCSIKTSNDNLSLVYNLTHKNGHYCLNMKMEFLNLSIMQ